MRAAATPPAYFSDAPFGKLMTTSGRTGKALAVAWDWPSFNDALSDRMLTA